MKKLLYRLLFARNNKKAFLKYAIKITDKIMLGTFVKAAIVYSPTRLRRCYGVSMVGGVYAAI